MPRQSRGRSSGAPRSAATAAPAKSQARGAHTATAPTSYAPSHAPAPPSASVPAKKEPGMIAQMAATAGSVAVGSTIGHGISSMLFGGGGSSEPTAAQQTHQQTNTQTMSCEVQAKNLTECVDNNGDYNKCSYYFDQLKACQAAAAPY